MHRLSINEDPCFDAGDFYVDLMGYEISDPQVLGLNDNNDNLFINHFTKQRLSG